MESERILLAMNNESTAAKLKVLLTENGYTVVDYARDGHDCLRKIRTLRPDLAMLEYNLPLMNGMDVGRVAVDDKLCDVIVIMSGSQDSMAGSSKSDNSIVCMTKPLNKANLISTIDLMFKAKRRISELEKQVEELRESLDTRKEVERAKGLLMKHMSLSEPEAFKRIQKQSMDRGISMREIAKAIILAYDI